jgi:ATP/ADP translocase
MQCNNLIAKRMEENKLNEMDYKPDFDILDRYINFSSELLRLSLLGISGFGALILYGNKENRMILNHETTTALFLAVIFLSIAAGFALAHRFFATDSMSYHVCYLRKNEQAEREGRNKRLKISGNMLIASEYSFAVGMILFAVGIYFFLP